MSDTSLKQIGSRICARRRELGLTQEVLADQMNVSVQMISNLERGNKAVRIDNLVRLSEILCISTDYILTGREFAATASFTEKIAALSPDNRRMLEMLTDYCLRERQ